MYAKVRVPRTNIKVKPNVLAHVLKHSRTNLERDSNPFRVRTSFNDITGINFAVVNRIVLPNCHKLDSEAATIVSPIRCRCKAK